MTHSTAPAILTVHVPMKFNLRGGRKTIISETISPTIPVRTENALLKALARAHRWRQQIENGEYASISELAKAQRVNESYACRLLRLTLLSPVFVTEILNERQNPQLTLKELMKPHPSDWTEQAHFLSVN